MRLFGNAKRRQDEIVLDPAYKGLRSQALNTKPADIGVTLDNNEQVYAAVADIPTKNGISTLVCVIGGTVSLYYSNGGGLIGLGQKYEEVRSAGNSFLISAGQMIPYLAKAVDFGISEDQKAVVFLLARDGYIIGRYREALSAGVELSGILLCDRRYHFFQ